VFNAENITATELELGIPFDYKADSIEPLIKE
jgi:hypothetical protein